MRIKNRTNDYYQKYQYLIWRDDSGFLEIDQFSDVELDKFIDAIREEKKKRNIVDIDIEDTNNNSLE
tara:strand:+ start:297 stop:497 length:201 start_codon:yes stop_codon:yes gene_type:complete